MLVCSSIYVFHKFVPAFSWFVVNLLSVIDWLFIWYHTGHDMYYSRSSRRWLLTDVLSQRNHVDVCWSCRGFCRSLLCISAAYAAARCLSVRPSCYLSRCSCIVPKRVVISSNLFTILVFHTKPYGNIPIGTPNWGKKIATNICLWDRWLFNCRQQFRPLSSL